MTINSQNSLQDMEKYLHYQATRMKLLSKLYFEAIKYLQGEPCASMGEMFENYCKFSQKTLKTPVDKTNQDSCFWAILLLLTEDFLSTHHE